MRSKGLFNKEKKVSSKEKGQAMVEMALILPILILILCGIIDFGWVFYNKLSVSYCSREGARYGIVHATDANAAELIESRVLEAAPVNLQDHITVSVTLTNASSPRLGDVSVEVTAQIDGLTPVAGTIFGSGGITLVSECVMKVE